MSESSSDILFEKFEVIECLKKDDNSGVYLARHVYLNKNIILKSLNTESIEDKERIERFKREAKILAQLEHPNIIKVLDFGTYKNFFYISFEYFESRNLRAVINQNSFSNEDKKNLIVQLFKGLLYAHQNNIIHRDLKPENILVNDQLKLKISDFGLALAINENFITSQYSIVGTPCYMSPEQIEGKSLSIQSDIFSVGIVVYELLTGTNPFLGNDVNESINNIINFSDSKLDQLVKVLPGEFVELLKKMLRRKIDNRFGSAADVLAMLGEEINSEFSYQKLSYQKKNSRRAILIVSTFAIIVIFVFVFISLSNDNSTSQIDAGEKTVLNDYNNKTESEPRSNNNNEIINSTNELNDAASDVKMKVNEQQVQNINDDDFAGAEIPPIVKTGKLDIECLPWAMVIIDSVEIDTTPLGRRLELYEGLHKLILVHPGYPEYKSTINIIPGELTSVKFNLDTLFGYLDCKIFPWGEVYVDNVKKGETPLLKSIILNPGNYLLSVRNPQYTDYDTMVRIIRNDTFLISYKFNTR